MKLFASLFVSILLSSPLCFAKGQALKVDPMTGRFQVMQISDHRVDQYLIDTQTGALWRNVCAVAGNKDPVSHCDLMVWERQKVDGLNFDMSKLSKSEKGLIQEDSLSDQQSSH